MPLPSWRLGCMLALCVACTADDTTSSASPIAALRAVEVPRTTVARFSVVASYRECDTIASDAGVPTPCSPAELPAALTREAAAVAALARGLSSAEAMHATALLDLLWQRGDDQTNHGALRLLDAALSSGAPSDDVLADIAAAHLTRAELTGDARAPLEAIDAATHALAFDPQHPAALFNRALACEWAGLTRASVRAWRDYLAVDSTSGWAAEARRRAGALDRAVQSRSASDDWSVLAGQDPQRLRERVWDATLPQWGESWLSGDSSRAGEALAQVRAAATALAGARGDSSLLVMHDEIRRVAGDRVRSTHLARLLARHGRARAAYIEGDYAAAGREWDQLAGRQVPTQLQPWIALFRAATLVYRRRPDEGERLIRAVLASRDVRTSPEITARARWILGTTLLRSGRARQALAEYQQSETLFTQAGERLNAASALSLQAEALLVLGDDHEGLARGRRAMAGLAPWGATVWLHNLLFVTSQSAARTGMPRAARAISDEDVGVSSALPVAIYEIEARIARAGLARLAGSAEDALVDLDTAQRALASLPIAGATEWLRANLLLARAALAIDESPAAAIAAFDTALLLVGPGDLFRRLPAHAGRARALLALDSVATAEREHGLAVAGLERFGTGVYESTQRLLLLGEIDRLTTRLAGRLLRDGDTVGALLAVERGRSRVAAATPTRAALASLEAPPRHLTVAYAFVGDTLIAWRTTGRGVVAHRRAARRGDILAAIAEVNGRFALGAADERMDSLLVRLHGWLADGVMPAASDSTIVTIVADGELADAPFAALRSATTGRYLVQDAELRFAPSVLMGPKGREPVAGPAIAIGVASGRAEWGLAPLPGAERESREVASFYMNGQVIADLGATAARVTEALRRSRIVHLAAHAVADPVRPLESFVFLGGSKRLTARQVAEMRLGALELVVLAACETQRGAEGGAGTMAGLTWAFLRAGARGVIGSSWRVDDEATRRLMAAMHRRHAAGTRASAALRGAQLEMLGDGDARWRSPASWAGFRYATATNHLGESAWQRQ